MVHKEEFHIVVNGTQHTVPKATLTFAEIVQIAFPNNQPDPNVVFSITFEHADSKPHQGTLAEKGSVTVKKHGTVFDVTPTNRS